MRLQNLTPKSYTDRLAGQKRKRQRRPVSCQQCRSRKIACDRGNPCSNCAKASNPMRLCSYENVDEMGDDALNSKLSPSSLHTISERQGQASKIPVAYSLDDRVTRIEKAIEGLAAKIDPAKSADLTTRSNSLSAISNDTLVEGGYQDEPSSTSNETSPYSEGVLATKRPGAIYYIGRSGWTMVNDDVS